MSLVPNYPEYPHMVNTKKSQHSLNSVQNLLDHPPSVHLLVTLSSQTNLHGRPRPEVSHHSLCRHSHSLTLILYECMPRANGSPNATLFRMRQGRLVPLVRRHKTPSSLPNPEIRPPPQKRILSRAYTLPHDRSTDVLEALPSGDSSINDRRRQEEHQLVRHQPQDRQRQQRQPQAQPRPRQQLQQQQQQQQIRMSLYKQLLSLLHRFGLEFCLNSLVMLLQRLASQMFDLRHLQALYSAYYYTDYMVELGQQLRVGAVDVLCRMRRIFRSQFALPLWAFIRNSLQKVAHDIATPSVAYKPTFNESYIHGLKPAAILFLLEEPCKECFVVPTYRPSLADALENHHVDTARRRVATMDQFIEDCNFKCILNFGVS